MSIIIYNSSNNFKKTLYNSSIYFKDTIYDSYLYIKNNSLIIYNDIASKLTIKNSQNKDSKNYKDIYFNESDANKPFNESDAYKPIDNIGNIYTVSIAPSAPPPPMNPNWLEDCKVINYSYKYALVDKEYLKYLQQLENKFINNIQRSHSNFN